MLETYEAGAEARRIQPPGPTRAEDDVFLADLVAGLTSSPKSLPSKYFYDESGSELFDLICSCDEYYPTRTEMSLLCTHGPELAGIIGKGADLVEFGSCNETKARILLSAMNSPRRYVPVDVSAQHLAAAARRMRRVFPRLSTQPLASDFTTIESLPASLRQSGNLIFYVAGSTIGNFSPNAARDLLGRWRALSPGCLLLLGVDLVKDESILNKAYNDAAGFTAQFNLNLLEHANRRLGTRFDTSLFEHVAFYSKDHTRIEMHLRSRTRQTMRIAGRTISFDEGETIRTEYSYKYTKDGFSRLAEQAGFATLRTWTDEDELFSLHLLRDAVCQSA